MYRETVKKALEYLQRAAESGLDIMQHELGVYYRTQHEYDNAIKWFTKAAEQGFARSQNELGLMFFNGEGVKKDSKRASQWFKKAAKQGHTGAQNNLAAIYAQKGNYDEAVKLWQQSAKSGYIESLSNLAGCYMNGNGVEENAIKALSLYQSAADMGDEYSANIVNKYNEILGTDFRQYILSSAIKSEEIWFPTSSLLFPHDFDNPKDLIKRCKKGKTLEQFFVGVAYLRGEYDFEKNVEKGLHWLNKAAKSDDSYRYFALNSLGNFYITQDNDDSAFEYYLKAASGNCDSALYNLAICYAFGIGTQVNIKEAMSYLNKAKEYGSINAKRALMLLDGESLDN